MYPYMKQDTNKYSSVYKSATENTNEYFHISNSSFTR